MAELKDSQSKAQRSSSARPIGRERAESAHAPDPENGATGRVIERVRIKQKVASAPIANQLEEDLRRCDSVAHAQVGKVAPKEDDTNTVMGRLSKSLQRCRADAEQRAEREAARQLKKDRELPQGAHKPKYER